MEESERDIGSKKKIRKVHRKTVKWWVLKKLAMVD